MSMLVRRTIGNCPWANTALKNINNRSMSTLSATDDLIVEMSPSGSTATLTLNRPKALNSLNPSICNAMRSLLEIWHNAPVGQRPMAFIVKGAGEKSFCAGGDVKSIWEEIASGSVPASDLGTGKPGYLHSDFFRQEYEMNHRLGTSEIPQISLWDGFVMGGGVGISVLGKYRVATEKTMFAMPETKIGLFPDVGSSNWLPLMQPPGVGYYLGLTGNSLFALDLLHCGIATHFVSSEKLRALEQALNHELREEKDVAEILAAFNSTPSETGKEIVLPNADHITKCFHNVSSYAEVISKLQDDGGEWATKTLKTLEGMSPTSCAVTVRQLNRGSGQSLKHCLEMEYRLAQRCMGGDFKEGIRALLVDKDKNPKWAQNPTEEQVEGYFQTLGEHELKL